MTEPNTPVIADDAVIEISDLDEFVKHLVEWHTSRVAQVKHMLTIPEGTDVSIDDAENVPLTGDLRKGFQAGLNTALSILGTLPFSFELEDDEKPALPN